MIVTYNSARFLPRLAEALKSCERIAAVSIVDNASVDESVALARDLDWGAPTRVTASHTNLGFGAAMNVASRSGGHAGQLLIINPDCVVDSQVIDRLSRELSDIATMAAIGAQLTTSDGAPVSSARDFPSLKSLALRRSKDVAHLGQLVHADWICGALMLWRRDAFESLNGFDERYFLYFEDVDICRRAWRDGRTIAIHGDLRAVHDQGHGETTSSFLRQQSRRSRRIYARKWLGWKGRIAAGVADTLDFTAERIHRARTKS